MYTLETRLDSFSLKPTKYIPLEIISNQNLYYGNIDDINLKDSREGLSMKYPTTDGLSNLHREVVNNRKLRENVTEFADEIAKILAEGFPDEAELRLPGGVTFKHSPDTSYAFYKNSQIIFGSHNKTPEDIQNFVRIITDSWLRVFEKQMETDNAALLSFNERIKIFSETDKYPVDNRNFIDESPEDSPDP